MIKIYVGTGKAKCKLCGMRMEKDVIGLEFLAYRVSEKYCRFCLNKKLNVETIKTEPIGCKKFDKENPELTRSCGDILFGNKIWLCNECYNKHKDNLKLRKFITR